MTAGDEVPAPKGSRLCSRIVHRDADRTTARFSTGNYRSAAYRGCDRCTLHIAARGVSGPVVVPLCAPCSSGATGTANINATVLEAIQNDRAYVNVHTKTNPAGEIRDQVSPADTLKTSLRAAQERPKPKGKVGRARGAFTMTITKKGSSAVLAWRLTFSRLTGKAVAAHIHSGARGKAGPVIVALCAPCKSGARGTATVDASVVSVLEAGRGYVNVHTKKNPAGEIRGQLGVAALTISWPNSNEVAPAD